MKKGSKVVITNHDYDYLIGNVATIAFVYKIIDWDIIYKLRNRNGLIKGWFNAYEIQPLLFMNMKPI